MAYQLDPKRATGAEIIRVGREQIVAAIQVVALRGAVDERARRARVRIKKVRAALRLVAPHAPARHAREDRYLRAAAGEVGPLRDCSVALGALDALRQQWGDKAERGGFTLVRRLLLAGQRQSQLTAMAGERRLTQLAQSLRQAEVRLAKWEVEGGGFEVMAEGFEESYRKARRAFRRARADDSAAVWHT